MNDKLILAILFAANNLCLNFNANSQEGISEHGNHCKSKYENKLFQEFDEIKNRKVIHHCSFFPGASETFYFEPDQLSNNEYRAHILNCINYDHMLNQGEKTRTECRYFSKLEYYVNYQSAKFQIPDNSNLPLFNQIAEAWHKRRIKWVYRLENFVEQKEIDENLKAKIIRSINQSLSVGPVLIREGANYYAFALNKCSPYSHFVRFKPIEIDGVVYLKTENYFGQSNH